MNFRNCIPDKVLIGFTDKWVSLLDGLLQFKHENLFKTVRVFNPILLNDEKWLLRKLSEFGLNLPNGFPIVILQQLLLNIDVIVKTRGSKIGTELFLSVLTLGEVVIDDSQFYERIAAMFLNSLSNGYLTDDSKKLRSFLVDDSLTLYGRSPLTIIIKSKFCTEEFVNSQIIKDYIEKELPNWTGFNPGKTFDIIYQYRKEGFYHKLLNPYFYE